MSQDKRTIGDNQHPIQERLEILKWRLRWLNPFLNKKGVRWLLFKNFFKSYFKGYLIWHPPIEWFVEHGYSRKEIAKEEAIKKYDEENEINSCCCSYCEPSDEELDESCYPYRFCGSGKIVHGPQDRFLEVFK